MWKYHPASYFRIYILICISLGRAFIWIIMLFLLLCYEYSLIISNIAAVWWRINVAIIPWWRHQMKSFSALLAICAGIHLSPANSPHKGQWRGALMFSLICAWINRWVNNYEAGNLRRHRVHYDVTVVMCRISASGANSSLGTSQTASDTGNVNQ